MKIRTISGELIELDEENKRARLLEGTPSSKRLSAEWRDYQEARPLGGSYLIVWGTGEDEFSASADVVGDPTAPGAIRTRTTWTSRVVEISP